MAKCRRVHVRRHPRHQSRQFPHPPSLQRIDSAICSAPSLVHRGMPRRATEVGRACGSSNCSERAGVGRGRRHPGSMSASGSAIGTTPSSYSRSAKTARLPMESTSGSRWNRPHSRGSESPRSTFLFPSRRKSMFSTPPRLSFAGKLYPRRRARRVQRYRQYRGRN